MSNCHFLTLFNLHETLESKKAMIVNLPFIDDHENDSPMVKNLKQKMGGLTQGKTNVKKVTLNVNKSSKIVCLNKIKTKICIVQKAKILE